MKADSVNSPEKVVVLQPSSTDGYYAYASRLRSMEINQRRLWCWSRVLLIDPADVDAGLNLSFEMYHRGDAAGAAYHLSRTVAQRPNDPRPLSNLCFVQKYLGEVRGALLVGERASLLDPANGLAQCNVGIALAETRNDLAALKRFEKSLTIDPGCAEYCANLAGCSERLKRFSVAMVFFSRACLISPNISSFVFDLALLNLRLGDFSIGWSRYESRLKTEWWGRKSLARVSVPRWSGGALSPSDRLLVIPEQGLGDSIQFFRFFLSLSQRQPRVRLALLAPERLRRLFGAMCDALPATSEKISDFDPTHQCSLMSLPFLLDAGNEIDIPFSDGYLNVAHDLIKIWKTRVRRQAERPLVGLMWRGSSAGKPDRRALTPDLVNLLLSANVDFISLQLGHDDAETKMLDFVGAQRVELDQSDFLDTAAIVSICDIVVSIDTSVAHLVGALGRPGLILLPFEADWRWHENSDSSIWYRSLRLFRQDSPGNWWGCVSRVVNHLNSLRVNHLCE